MGSDINSKLLYYMHTGLSSPEGLDISQKLFEEEHPEIFQKIVDSVDTHNKITKELQNSKLALGDPQSTWMPLPYNMQPKTPPTKKV